nr:2-amino-4-hydroxy-6-hydroxymethyldihydropteridine diphosphokinase [Frigidibacter sp. ROC022]
MGSNATSAAGAPAETLHAALRELKNNNFSIAAISRFYESPAYPAGAGPDFVNAAIRLGDAPPPQRLLETLHRIEAQFGRVRRQRWGPRVLDLDLLARGGTVLPDPATLRRWIDLPPEAQRRETPDRLLLPHPRLQDRAFVLLPLLDIAPDWRHPLLGLTVRQMVAALPSDAKAAMKPL